MMGEDSIMYGVSKGETSLRYGVNTDRVEKEGGMGGPHTGTT